LKPEGWGSPLAQEEKYQGRKKTCDKMMMMMMIIIIITIIITPSVCKLLQITTLKKRKPNGRTNKHLTVPSKCLRKYARRMEYGPHKIT
jgi:hypothetical protein